ncbi:MAG TPA: hypothetical protein VFS19_07175 [Planctomycetota bacterium]|nr:hypothetical protein [Planctomycetota bacterium]
MRKIVIGAAVAALCGWSAAQDMGGGAQEEKACDLAKVESRDYCAGCKGWPASDQVEKGACKKCKGKVEKMETCVKVYWDCPKMHGSPKRHAKNCCTSKTCCTETPSLALVWLECGACKARALKEADLKHKEKCEGKAKKVCAESTKFPHGGEE